MYNVVYCSETGSTKSYAEAFAERLGCPLISIEEYSNQADVVFFGWVSGSVINGLKEVPKENICIVCAVGLDILKDDTISALKKKNKVAQEIFYLRGAVNRDMLSFGSKMILAFIGAFRKKKTDDDRAIVNAIKNGGSFYSIEQLDPVIAYAENHSKQ